MFSGGSVRDIAGSGDNKSKDGSSSSCTFVQPTAVCIEGNTIYVADTAVAWVCIAPSTSALSLYLKQTDIACRTFGIAAIAAIAAFCGVSSLLNTWETEAAESLGRLPNVQGPQGTPSSKSIKSVKIMLDSLEMLNQTLSYVNTDSIAQLRLASLLTLVVEVKKPYAYGS